MTRPSASLNWYEPGASGMVPAGGRWIIAPSMLRMNVAGSVHVQAQGVVVDIHRGQHRSPEIDTDPRECESEREDQANLIDPAEHEHRCHLRDDEREQRR